MKSCSTKCFCPHLAIVAHENPYYPKYAWIKHLLHISARICTVPFVGLTAFLVIGLVAISVAALGNIPQLLFTDNIFSGGPTSQITEMEQALINGHYEYLWASIR